MSQRLVAAWCIALSLMLGGCSTPDAPSSSHASYTETRMVASQAPYAQEQYQTPATQPEPSAQAGTTPGALAGTPDTQASNQPASQAGTQAGTPSSTQPGLPSDAQANATPVSPPTLPNPKTASHTPGQPGVTDEPIAVAPADVGPAELPITGIAPVEIPASGMPSGANGPNAASSAGQPQFFPDGSQLTDHGLTPAQLTSLSMTPDDITVPLGLSKVRPHKRITIWIDGRVVNIAGFAIPFTQATGIGVDIVRKEEQDLDREFSQAVLHGHGPDLVVLAHDRLGALVAQGVVRPYDVSHARIASGAVAAVAYGQQTYGVPYAIEGVALVRNNAITQEVPFTYDEMLRVGRVSKLDRPFLLQIGAGVGDPYHMYGFQTSFGAPVFAQLPSGAYTPDVRMGGAPGRQFSQWLRAQGADGYIDPALDSTNVVGKFINGESPFIITGPWNLKAFEQAGMDISVLPLPRPGPYPARPFVGIQAFFASSQTQHPKEVTALLDWLTTKEAQERLLHLDKRIPVHHEVASQLDDPILKAWAAAIAHGLPMPSIPEMKQVWNYWSQAELDIIQGRKDPTDVWQGMVRTVRTAITK